MGRLALGLAGAAVGSFFGSPQIGFLIGSTAGQFLFAPKTPDVEGPRLEDLSVQSSAYGAPVPRVWGEWRLGGNVIWALPIREQKNEEDVGKGGGNTITTYEYFGTFAVALCLGPRSGAGIIGVRRIWLDAQLAYDFSDSADPQSIYGMQETGAQGLSIYLGTDAQLPSALQESVEGVGNVPGYRGVVYLELEELNLGPFGNRLPNVTAEVIVQSTDSYLVNPPWTARPSVAQGNLPLYERDGLILFADAQGTLVDQTRTVNRNETRLDGTPLGTITVPYTAAGTPQIYAYCWDTGVTGLASELAVGASGSILVWFVAGSAVEEALRDSAAALLPVSAYNGLVADRENQAVYLWVNEIPANNRLYAFRAELSDEAAIPATQAYAEYDPGAGLQVLDVHAKASGVYALVDLVGGVNSKIVELDPADMTEIRSWTLSPAESTFDRNSSLMLNGTDTRVIIARGGGVNGFAQVWAIEGTTITRLFEGFVNDGGSSESMKPVRVGNMLLVRGQYVAFGLLGSGQVAVSEIITDVCLEAGLESADIDVTGVTRTVNGYLVPRPMTARAALENLLEAFQIDAVESDHVIRFIERGAAPVASLGVDALGARLIDAGAGLDDGQAVRLTVERGQESERVRQLTWRYRDPGQRHEAAAQVYQVTDTTSDNDVVLDVPVAVDANTAAEMAERLVLANHVEREEFAFSVGGESMVLDPGDVVTLDTGTRTVQVRVIEADLDLGVGLNRLRAVANQALLAPNPGITNPQPDDTIPLAGATALSLLDIPLLLDRNDGPGFYWTGSGYYPGWPGAQLAQSKDAGATWSVAGVTTVSGDEGFAEGALADGPASYDWNRTDWTAGNEPWDTVNTVTVQLRTAGTLGNASSAEVLAGANTAVLGDELIGWQTAADLGAGRYTLSNLLRGRRGSQDARLTHAAQERFVVLRLTGTQLLAHSADDFNRSYVYRAPTLGADLFSASQVSFTNTGIILRPFSVVGLAAGMPNFYDVPFTWHRRSRLGTEYRNFVTDPPPLDAALEAYSVEIFDTANALRRRETVTSNAYTYTQAKQQQDFGYPGPAYDLVVRQINEAYPGQVGPPQRLSVPAVADYDPESPTSANLILWLDVSDAANRTVVDDKVSALTDKSTKTNHANQSVAASRPALAAAAYTSLDGTARDAARWTTPAGTENIFMTVANSADFDVPAANNAITVLVAADFTAGGYTAPALLNKSASDTGDWGLFLDPTNANMLWHVGAGQTTDARPAGMAVYAALLTTAGAERVLLSNDTPAAVDAHTGGLTNTATALHLGALGESGGTATNCWSGTIGEVRVYDAALSNEDLSANMAQLLAKWGVSITSGGNGSTPVDPEGNPLYVAAADIAAGDIVQVFFSDGMKVRPADALLRRRAHGIALGSAATGQQVPVQLGESLVSGLTGLVGGAQQFLGQAGKPSATRVPTGIVQSVGVALSATELAFRPGEVYSRGA